MTRKILLIFTIIFSSITEVLAAKTSYQEVDFDISMGKKNLAQYNLMLRDNNSKNLLKFFRQAYYEQLPSKKEMSEKPKIPKVIHQIWVGKQPLPSYAGANMQSCVNIHKDWKFEFWDDKRIKKAGYNKHPVYEMYKDSPIAQKEVVQFQILKDHGGVAMDIDFVCLKPLDELHHKYNFYSGLKPPSKVVNYPLITTSIIGASPGDGVFDVALAMSQDKLNKFNKKENSYWKKAYRKVKNYVTGKYDDPVKKLYHQRVMPNSLGRAFMTEYSSMKDMIIFPCTYFSPIFPSQKDHYEVIDKMRLRMGVITEQQVFSSKKPESIAVQIHQK